MFQSQSSFLVLYTSNVQNTKTFFTVLGIELIESTEEKVVVTFGGFNLHYILNTSEPFKDYQYIAEPDHYGQGIIFYIESDNLVQTKERVVKAGGTIVSEIFENKWNCQELLAEDPNGYKFAFYS